MSTSVRPRPSPANSPRTSPCSSPRFSRRNLRSPAAGVKKCIMPVLVVHGGAAKVHPKHATLKMAGIKCALSRGYQVLMSPRGSALDAVEAAVRVMEDDPAFNAGYGSSLTVEGQVEMDALVMEGTKMRAGAVAGVTITANPVSLARKVMEQSDHVFLVGEAAHNFAHSVGLPLVAREKLITEMAQERLEEHQTFVNTINADKDAVCSLHDHDTVGAVAVDSHGHVACATSTGGITAKQSGRVGDTPLVGSGGYADDFGCAVSTTGHGEAIMRVCLARHIAGLIQQGMNAQDAVVAGLEYMRNRVQGHGGAVAVTPQGDIGVHFTTLHMAWGYRRGNTLHFGLRHNEDSSEDANVMESSP